MKVFAKMFLHYNLSILVLQITYKRCNKPSLFLKKKVVYIKDEGCGGSGGGGLFFSIPPGLVNTSTGGAQIHIFGYNLVICQNSIIILINPSYSFLHKGPASGFWILFIKKTFHIKRRHLISVHGYRQFLYDLVFLMQYSFFITQHSVTFLKNICSTLYLRSTFRTMNCNCLFSACYFHSQPLQRALFEITTISPFSFRANPILSIILFFSSLKLCHISLFLYSKSRK
jgi:hypothetical protein